MCQSDNARIRLSNGAIKKGVVLASVGKVSSFEKSFNASANGCGSPIRLTLLGPFRS